MRRGLVARSRVVRLGPPWSPSRDSARARSNTAAASPRRRSRRRAKQRAAATTPVRRPVPEFRPQLHPGSARAHGAARPPPVTSPEPFQSPSAKQWTRPTATLIVQPQMDVQRRGLAAAGQAMFQRQVGRLAGLGGRSGLLRLRQAAAPGQRPPCRLPVPAAGRPRHAAAIARAGHDQPAGRAQAPGAAHGGASGPAAMSAVVGAATGLSAQDP